MKRVLFVMSNKAIMENGKPAGCYIPELTHPLYTIKNRNIKVDFCSPNGGSPAFTGTNYNDPLLIEMLSDTKIMNQISNTIAVKDVDPEKYDVIFYTGGHGGMYDFVDNKTLNTIAETIYDNGGIISALCHGPAGLIDLKKSNGEYLIKGKKVTCFTKEEEIVNDLIFDIPYILEDKLIARGAKYRKNGVNQGGLQISGRLITGQNLNSSHMIGRAISEKLGR